MQLSRRSTFETKLNRLSILLQRKMAGGATLLDLTQSNPTQVGFQYPPSLLSALTDASSLQYHPAPAGLSQARSAVAAYYAEKKQRVNAENIFLAASTSEAYSWLFKLLADPGDRVTVPRPSYPLLDHLAALESVILDRYLLRYDGAWHVDLADLERSITEATRAVVYVNPNNPTGSFLTEPEWARLSEICNRHSLALIIDEVFSDFSLDGSAGFSRDAIHHVSTSHLHTSVQTVAGRHDCLNFVLSGFSKVLCLPQMKLGWIVVQGPEEQRLEACSRLEFIADTFLSVNTPVQTVAATWLGDRRQMQAQVLERISRNLSFLRDQVRNSPCCALNVEGGWYAILQVPQTRTEEEWVLTLLEKDNVQSHPGYFFDFEREAFLIVSLLPEPSVFEPAVQRLVRRVVEMSNVA
ncbi:MAG: pyridoxal phosphate-dependent aminotransferase [Acidobacteria bacterium]|nr:pyridoxal phosphate-dependent aminotransferase [Acidobacteriota bacterium]